MRRSHVSHSGTSVKALTYGNLGSGGLSKATFEQTAEFGFMPGFGTHTVEHRAIDAAGNTGDAEEYRATVLPGGSPDCTATVTGTYRGNLTVSDGVTCLVDAHVLGFVKVEPGASLVATDGLVNGTLSTVAADVVQLFGTTVLGAARIGRTASDVTIAGSSFGGRLTLAENTQISANELFGDYGPVLVGNSAPSLDCRDNSSAPRDFGAPNSIAGATLGQCAGL